MTHLPVTLNPDDDWHVIFASGPDAHVRYSRVIKRIPCTRTLQYGVPCPKSITIHEVVYDNHDGTRECAQERSGCLRCHRLIDASRATPDDPWEPLWHQLEVVS